MVAAWANKMAFSLFVQPTIQTTDQLRDKRLSVTRRGSASEIWAGAILERFGLESERDYHFVAVGGQPEQLAALQAGGTDGAIIGPPTNVRARQMGLRELLSYQEYFLPMADVGLVTSRRYLREHPDVVERLLRASAEAVALEFAQPERALASLARGTETDDRELLEETLRFQDSRTDRTMTPSPDGMRAAVDELARSNPKAGDGKPRRLLRPDTHPAPQRQRVHQESVPLTGWWGTPPHPRSVKGAIGGTPPKPPSRGAHLHPRR